MENGISMQTLVDEAALAHGTGSLPHIDALLRMARYLQANLQADRAIEIQQKAVELSRTHQGPTHYETAYALEDLAITQLKHNQYQEAEKSGQEAVAILDSEYSGETLDLGVAHRLLADIVSTEGKGTEATVHYRTAVSCFDRALGHSHSYTIAAYNGLLGSYRLSGNWTELEALAKRRLDERDKPKSDKREIAFYYIQIAFARLLQSDFENALAHMRKADAIYSDTLKRQHPLRGTVYTGLGMIYNGMFPPKLADAEFYARRGIEVYEANHLNETPDWYYASLVLAISLREQDKLKEAEGLLDKLWKSAVHSQGVSSLITAQIASVFATIKLRQRIFEQAESWFAQALEIRSRTGHVDDVPAANDLYGLGLVQVLLHKSDKGVELIHSASALFERLRGRDNLSTAIVLFTLANVYFDVRIKDPILWRELRADFELTVSAYERAFGKNSANLVLPLMRQGVAEKALGNRAKAEALGRRGKAIADQSFKKGTDEEKKVTAYWQMISK